MKIALCMSGGLRCYKDTYNHFKKFILNNLDCDLFFYGTENKEGAKQNFIDFTTLHSPKKCVINTIEYYNDLIYKKFDINNLQLQKGAPAHRLKNMIPMFYNIRQCYLLKEQYEKETGITYDTVVRLRPDVFFIRNITTEEFEKASSGILVIPDAWNFGGITDLFAMSNSITMNTYSKIYESLQECFLNGVFHAETITKYNLDKYNIKIDMVSRHHENEYPESLDLSNPNSLVWDRTKGYERNLKYSFDKS